MIAVLNRNYSLQKKIYVDFNLLTKCFRSYTSLIFDFLREPHQTSLEVFAKELQKDHSKLLNEPNMEIIAKIFLKRHNLKFTSENIAKKVPFKDDLSNLDKYCRSVLNELNYEFDNYTQSRRSILPIDDNPKASKVKHKKKKKQNTSDYKLMDSVIEDDDSEVRVAYEARPTIKSGKGTRLQSYRAKTISKGEFELFKQLFVFIMRGLWSGNVIQMFATLKEMKLKKLYVRLLTEFVWNSILIRGDWRLNDLFPNIENMYQVIILKILYGFPESELKLIRREIGLLEDHIYSIELRMNFFMDDFRKPESSKIEYTFLIKSLKKLKSIEHCQNILQLFSKMRRLIEFNNPNVTKRFESLTCLIFNWPSYFFIRDRFATNRDLERKAVVIVKLENLVDSSDFASLDIFKGRMLKEALSTFQTLDLSFFTSSLLEETVYKYGIFPMSFLLKVVYFSQKTEMLRSNLSKQRKLKRHCGDIGELSQFLLENNCEFECPAVSTESPRHRDLNDATRQARVFSRE